MKNQKRVKTNVNMTQYNSFKNDNIVEEYKIFLSKYYKKKYDFSAKHQKFHIETIIKAYIQFTKSSISYNDFIYHNEENNEIIKGHSLWNHICFFRSINLPKIIYERLLKKYLSKRRTSKLKYQSLDTTFVQNFECTEDVARNAFFKNKKGFKISTVVDANGIPLSVAIEPANRSDVKIGFENLELFMTETKTLKYKNHNRYKQYMLCDKAYDSSEFRNELIRLGYTPVIDHNRRNIQDENLVQKLTETEQQIYNYRLVIENYHSWLKNYKRINIIYEKTYKSYESFLYLALSVMLDTKTNNNSFKYS